MQTFIRRTAPISSLRRCGRLLTAALIIIALSTFASAGENGGHAWPFGVETVLTAMQPGPGQTSFNYYSAYYYADKLVDTNGNSIVPDFKIQLFVNAVRLNHNWGKKFLGANVGSQVAVPFVYQHLNVPGVSGQDFGINNTDFIPVSLYYHKGFASWYVQADIVTPASGYAPNKAVSIGQHYWSGGPVFGFTLMPNKGKTEIGGRFSYFLMNPNHNTNYHSGNELGYEFTVGQNVTKKINLGVVGVYFKQTTDDTLNGQRYLDGFRGRVLKIGPQIRLPLGKNGGFAIKYLADTCVQNKPVGHSLWFQMGIPFPGLSKKEH